MEPKEVFQLLKETVQNWLADKAPRLGAALAYYSIFSLSPLLIIAIGIAGLVFGPEAARGEIVEQISQTVGEPVALALQSLLASTEKTGGATAATIIGIVLLLFGASGVFVQLQDALNTIWKVAPKPGLGIKEMVWDRLLSLGLVLTIGFLLLVSLVVSAGLQALVGFLTPASLPGGAFLWQVISFLVSFGVLTLLLALLYKFLPDVHVRWRDIWIGAAMTALLFAVGKYLIGMYLGRGTTTSAFGAAGSLVVILIWVYYSAQIFLFGAEFIRAYAAKCGAKTEPKRHAVALGPGDLARQGVRPSGAATSASTT